MDPSASHESCKSHSRGSRPRERKETDQVGSHNEPTVLRPTLKSSKSWADQCWTGKPFEQPPPRKNAKNLKRRSPTVKVYRWRLVAPRCAPQHRGYMLRSKIRAMLLHLFEVPVARNQTQITSVIVETQEVVIMATSSQKEQPVNMFHSCQCCPSSEFLFTSKEAASPGVTSGCAFKSR